MPCGVLKTVFAALMAQRDRLQAAYADADREAGIALSVELSHTQSALVCTLRQLQDCITDK